MNFILSVHNNNKSSRDFTGNGTWRLFNDTDSHTKYQVFLRGTFVYKVFTPSDYIALVLILISIK